MNAALYDAMTQRLFRVTDSLWGESTRHWWNQNMTYHALLQLLQDINYRTIIKTRHTKSENFCDCRLVLQLPWTIHWSQVLRWEWRCSWSSAYRRCSNYIWVINNFIANSGAPYIRGLTVLGFEVTSVDYRGPLNAVGVTVADSGTDDWNLA